VTLWRGVPIRRLPGPRNTPPSCGSAPPVGNPPQAGQLHACTAPPEDDAQGKPPRHPGQHLPSRRRL